MPNNKGGKNYKKGKKDNKPKTSNIRKTQDTEIYGEVIKINGNGRFTVRCTDGIERLGIIRGKLRKRAWVNMNSIVLADVWNFEDKKCSIIHIYDSSDIEILLESREIPETLISNNDELYNDFEEDIEIKTYDIPPEESSSDDEEIDLDDI
uniref:S1-like domain-containing protein n=1 Tax=viral metagenome TaxID=1070528 RepID=A0A6C0CYU3_9ZZZZ